MATLPVAKITVLEVTLLTNTLNATEAASRNFQKFGSVTASVRMATIPVAEIAVSEVTLLTNTMNAMESAKGKKKEFRGVTASVRMATFPVAWTVLEVTTTLLTSTTIAFIILILIIRCNLFRSIPRYPQLMITFIFPYPGPSFITTRNVGKMYF